MLTINMWAIVKPFLVIIICAAAAEMIAELYYGALQALTLFTFVLFSLIAHAAWSFAKALKWECIMIWRKL